MSDEDSNASQSAILDEERTEDAGSITQTESTNVSQENSDNEDLTQTDEDAGEGEDESLEDGEDESEEEESGEEEGDEEDGDYSSQAASGSLEESEEGSQEEEDDDEEEEEDDEEDSQQDVSSLDEGGSHTESQSESVETGQSESVTVTASASASVDDVPETITPPATPPSTNTLTPPPPTAPAPDPPPPLHTDAELAIDTMGALDKERKTTLHIRDRLRTLEGHAKDVVEHKHEDEEEKKMVDAKAKAKALAEKEKEKEKKATTSNASPTSSQASKSPSKKKQTRAKNLNKKPGLFGLQKHNLMMMARAKRVAKKTKEKARGTGHKAYRCRLEILHKGKYRPAWMVFKSGVIKCHETHKEKVVNNVGVTQIEWPVGKVLLELDVSSAEAYISVIPENVKPNAVKVSTSFNSIYFSSPNPTVRDRFLKGIQQVVKLSPNRPGAGMLQHIICCCCSIKNSTYLPAPPPTSLYLPAPFYLSSKMICTSCSSENSETRRRELSANVLNPFRKVGDSTCHSQMKMWTPCLPYKSQLPLNANFESYVREVKSRCVDSGIKIPASRVNLIELGKKRPKQLKRSVDGRLEDVYEWRKRKEANFVVEKFTVKDLTK
ncbi:hypothetical protein TrST_g442 [Triparma strigata]|uniref:Uncharacterized protein n=1 Tax=Triparma strigata TaxID=1606541 RepID=A0A9W7BBI6_9STRA|nr:hypothetical protein TrST_g442 [Triparma strigata]